MCRLVTVCREARPQGWPPTARKLPTCVAQGQLLLAASLVVPHARVPDPLDVDLHTVLVGLLIVRFAWSPVLGFLGQRLLGPYPDPLIVDLSDPNPVVSGGVGEYGVQVLDLFLVLNRNQVGVPLLAVGAGLIKSQEFCGGVVRPGATLSEQEKH